MRLEEGMNLAHRQGDSLLGFFPREHAHFGLWREHRALHGDGVWVRGDLVRQDQDWVWQLRTKSRVTVKTKSGLVSNILVTNWSAVWIVISGRLAVSAGPQVVQNAPGYLRSRMSGRHPTGCASSAAAIRSGARFKRPHMKGPPMQKPITMNLSMPR